MTRVLALALAVVSSWTASAQADTPTSPAATSPIEDPSGRALRRFLDGLARCQGGQTTDLLRVTHYGDSHVASDAFTGHLRGLLQARCGSAGPGFVLFGKPWPSYQQRLIRSGVSPRRAWRAERQRGRYSRKHPAPRDDLFGVAGVSVHAARSGARAWIALRNARGPLRAATLHFLRQPTGGTVDVLADEGLLERLRTRAKTTGAATRALDLSEGARRVDLVVRGDGEVRIFGADLRSAKTGLLYDALGINGARAQSLLGGNEQLLRQQLGALDPTLIVVAYGANEVDQVQLTPQRFAADFDAVLGRLRGAAPKAACLVVGPPDRAVRSKRAYEIPPQLDWIIAEQRRAAFKRGCAFWDQRRAMGGAGSIERWRLAHPPLATRDRVHLTGSGYRLLAEALHVALRHARNPAPVTR